MFYMRGGGYRDNFCLVFLPISLSTSGIIFSPCHGDIHSLTFSIQHGFSTFSTSDCKINKFISFLGKNRWKTCKFYLYNPVYIHLASLRAFLCVDITTVIHRVIHIMWTTGIRPVHISHRIAYRSYQKTRIESSGKRVNSAPFGRKSFG